MNRPAHPHQQSNRPQGGGGNTTAGSAVDAPYNFVPLANWVFKPDWGHRVSHEVPFKDGISGSLDVEYTAHTPLLCGDEPHPASKEKAGEVHFVKSGGRYLIPGSSQKGMLRDALEIASFGRMRALDDRRFALRDISNADRVPYGRVMVDQATKKSRVRAGFLSQDKNEGITLTPCHHVFLPHTELLAYFGKREGGPLHDLFNSKDHKAVACKYRRWAELCRQQKKPADKICFDEITEPFKTKKGEQLTRQISVALGSGLKDGVPVFTGQINGKKRDFVFFDPDESAKSTLTPEEWRDFLFTHGDDEKKAGDMSWPGYWRDRFFDKQQVPVFFIERKWGRAIGLSFMPRLAGDYSTHDLVNAVSADHMAELQDPAKPEYDLAELMFGTLGACQEASIASRVSFEPAFADGPQQPITSPETVLNSPKPSYFPNYLVQPPNLAANASKPFRTYVDFGEGKPPTLRGRKRYPVRDQDQIKLTAPPEAVHGEQNHAVCVKLHPLPAGTRFQGRIVFHNLRPAELGALVWSLTLGDTRHRHALGMGKPFGYGQLQAKIVSEELAANDGRALDSTAECVAAFTHLMDHACQQNAKCPWQQTEAMRLFLAMSDPAQAKRVGGGLQSGFPGRLEHMRLVSGANNPFVRVKSQGLSLAPYLPDITLRDNAQRTIGAPKAAAASGTAPAAAAKEAAPPVTVLWTDAKAEYDVGRGVITLTDPNNPSLTAVLDRHAVDDLRKRHPEWIEKLKRHKKKTGKATLTLTVEGERSLKPQPETLVPNMD